MAAALAPSRRRRRSARDRYPLPVRARGTTRLHAFALLACAVEAMGGWTVEAGKFEHRGAQRANGSEHRGAQRANGSAAHAALWSLRECSPHAAPCWPRDLYVSHIPKTGGSSLAHDIQQGAVPPLEPCNGLAASGIKVAGRMGATCNVWGSEGDVDEEVPKLAAVATAPLGLITMVREPLFHVRSMYAHCQSGFGMSLHNYTRISFSSWLRASLERPRPRRHSPGRTEHCNYDPMDKMTQVLADGDLRRAVEVVDGAVFVGVTAHYDASVCLLRSVLIGRRACECAGAPRTGTRSGPGTNRGALNRAEEVRISTGDVELIEQLTRRDAIVYARGLSRFYDGIERFNLTCRLIGRNDTWRRD